MLKVSNSTSKKRIPSTGLKTRTCKTCHEDKDISRYEISKGYRTRVCRECRQIGKNKNMSQSPYAYINNLYAQLSHRRKKTHEFNITKEDLHKLYDKQKGICMYSGIEMKHLKDGTGYHLDNISIDRIDNTKGYVKGNIALVCLAVNMMKYTLELDELIDWCKKISKAN